MSSAEKFKVGDRFTVNEDDLCGGYKAGDEFEVIGFDGGVTFIDNDGDKRYLGVGHISLVPVAEATGTDAQADKPKFKVGDRVRYKNGWGGATVVAVNVDGSLLVDTHSGYGICTEQPRDLEPVAVAQQPQPLRIQPGKFYLTRDGRNVGPMRRWSDEARHRWEADDDDLPYIWADDGTEIDSDIDDSADLVAEASSSDNGSADRGSTAGFTVPLCAYEDEPGWYAAELGRAYADGYAAGLRAAA